jgi:flagellar hook protein FlgE
MVEYFELTKMARLLLTNEMVFMSNQKTAENIQGRSPMINPTDNSLSALSAFRKKMDVTANNIANVLTDEFKKSRVTFEDASPGGVAAVIDRVETQGVPKETIRDDHTELVESSNVDLGEELTDIIPTQTAYSANLKTLKAQDEMMGSLLNIFS